MRCARVLFILLTIACGARALESFDLIPGQDVVGRIRFAETHYGETLAQFAMRHQVGFYELIEANPDLSPDKVLRSGTEVLIPSRYVLPDAAPKEGIVVNMADLRLYYYPKGERRVVVMSAGVGRTGWLPEMGRTTVTGKEENPVWHVPLSIKKEAAQRGVTLPDEVPAGPHNPLGKHRFWLGMRGFLIHGTNDPSGVGRRSSSGCIRLYPSDVAWLYEHVPIGTPVYFINQPFKLGRGPRGLYLEAHQLLQEDLVQPRHPHVEAVMRAFLRLDPLGRLKWDTSAIRRVTREQTGIPELVAQG